MSTSIVICAQANSRWLEEFRAAALAGRGVLAVLPGRWLRDEHTVHATLIDDDNLASKR